MEKFRPRKIWPIVVLAGAILMGSDKPPAAVLTAMKMLFVREIMNEATFFCTGEKDVVGCLEAVTEYSQSWDPTSVYREATEETIRRCCGDFERCEEHLENRAMRYTDFPRETVPEWSGQGPLTKCLNSAERALYDGTMEVVEGVGL